MRLPNGPCPKCGSAANAISIELHPTDNNLAIMNYECPRCGVVPKTVTIGTDKPSERLK